MGLIKDSYTSETTGVTYAPAYAKIVRLYNESNDNATSYFGISNSRSKLEEYSPAEEIAFSCTIDKAEDRIFNEVYTKAKLDTFSDWQDDIVES